jgi:hypothetical protein
MAFGARKEKKINRLKKARMSLDNKVNSRKAVQLIFDQHDCVKSL